MLGFLAVCRLCYEGRVPKETRGRPLFMLHPMGTLLLMMRLLTPLGIMIPNRVSFLVVA